MRFVRAPAVHAVRARDLPGLLPARCVAEELARAVGIGVAVELRFPKRNSASAFRHRSTQAADSGLGQIGEVISPCSQAKLFLAALSVIGAFQGTVTAGIPAAVVLTALLVLAIRLALAQPLHTDLRCRAMPALPAAAIVAALLPLAVGNAGNASVVRLNIGYLLTDPSPRALLDARDRADRTL